jgi:hypothetical protein
VSPAAHPPSGQTPGPFAALIQQQQPLAFSSSRYCALHALGWRLHAAAPPEPALAPAVPPLAPPLPADAPALPPVAVAPAEPPLLSSLLPHPVSAASPTVAEAPVTTSTLKNLLISILTSLHRSPRDARALERTKTQRLKSHNIRQDNQHVSVQRVRLTGCIVRRIWAGLSEAVFRARRLRRFCTSFHLRHRECQSLIHSSLLFPRHGRSLPLRASVLLTLLNSAAQLLDRHRSRPTLTTQTRVGRASRQTLQPIVPEASTTSMDTVTSAPGLICYPCTRIAPAFAPLNARGRALSEAHGLVLACGQGSLISGCPIPPCPQGAS